jgi:hypothetical protein
MVNQGPALKRFIPAPRGSANPIRKESCHVYMEIGSKAEEMNIKVNDKVEQSNNTEE